MAHTVILPFAEITPDHRARAGGKALALALMAREDLRVPDGICLLTDAYTAFTAESGMAERISLELSRKRFEDMRWEELWDTALRIRNAFLRAPWPETVRDTILTELAARWGAHLEETPLAVRSSSPGEDTLKTSFAGLHESYVNVRGAEGVLEAVRGVWASLWSDRALLYRQELGLDVHTSAMAVVVQEMVLGDCSGVAFSQSPTDPTRLVIEAVWGLNEGLVDGTVEPDHWELARDTAAVLEHRGVERSFRLAPSENGARLEPLDPIRSARAPLTDAQVTEVATLARRSETLFGPPQDVEWTFRDDRLYVVQSRPVSTLDSGGDTAADAAARTTATPDGGASVSAVGRSDRAWYLSLHRSFDNLKLLRERIEGEYLPAMSSADRMSRVDLKTLTDRELRLVIEERQQIRDGWLEVYWRDFIPFAHGMRLFGQVYNDDLRPEDPFAFLDLLTGGDLMSLERNTVLAGLAQELAHEPDAAGLNERLDAYLDRYGSGPGAPADLRERERAALRGLLRQLPAHTPSASTPFPAIDRASRTAAYLALFSGAERAFREELLDLARSSYRLRDHDNLCVDRIEAQLTSAVEDGRRRLGPRAPAEGAVSAVDIIRALEDPAAVIAPAPAAGTTGEVMPMAVPRVTVRARQLVGQPAGPGLAAGTARVVMGQADLFTFQTGEVLVCDALDPKMTFVAPLASAIVERRGGMLIHGAIIAREYGLPCVTGVPMATEVIRTGDHVTVDGYLGIVVVAPGMDRPVTA